MPQLCPCGSGRTLAACCGRYHQGQPAPTAEALMRSRYSAYVLGAADYLRATWHPTCCPAELDPSQGPHWLGLEIVTTEGGGAGESRGVVEFIARYLESGRVATLHERSRFIHEGGRWYYLDGEINTTATPQKRGRNEPCPCGSGKKFKRCCGRGAE